MQKRQKDLFDASQPEGGPSRPADHELRELVSRIHPKFQPAWNALADDQQLALAAYFLPRKSKQEFLSPTRPQVLGWYCPFAAQCDFPSGHRYCLNVYSGCSHDCEYCYVVSYSTGLAKPKPHFERKLTQDLSELDAFELPPAPIHLSNSTDPFQPLERQHGHTRLALEKILAHRHRFTTVTLLTKNPQLAAKLGYLDLLRAHCQVVNPASEAADPSNAKHPPFQVQVSLAFWREEASQAYDCGAPSVEDRKAGIRALREAGVPVVLRIDPLFPRSPLPLDSRPRMDDFGLAEAQTRDDLEQLVEFAQEVGARHIVYSAAKVVRPRRRALSPAMSALRDLYRALSAPENPVRRGGSWRLPRRIAAEHVVEPLLEICRRKGVTAKFCMQDLVEIP